MSSAWKEWLHRLHLHKTADYTAEIHESIKGEQGEEEVQGDGKSET